MAIKLGEGFVEAVLRDRPFRQNLSRLERDVRSAFRRMQSSANISVSGSPGSRVPSGTARRVTASGPGAAAGAITAAKITASSSAIAGAVGGVAAAAVMKLTQLFERLKQAVASFVKTLVVGMIESSARLEQFRLSLGVLLKDQEKANILIKDIQEFAAKTPFNTGNLLEAVQLLKAFGFETRKILPMLRIIGDAAAASPQGMQFAVGRISLVLGQIRSANRLLGQDILQLTSAGVPVHEIIKEQFGKSVSEVQDLVRKGKINIEQVIDGMLAGMDRRFGGMMKKLSLTWNGLISTLQDQWEIFLQNIGGPLFERVRGILQNVIEFLESDAFANFQTKLADGMEGALRTVEQIASVIRDEWIPLAQSFAKFIDPTGVGKFILGGGFTGLAFRGTVGKDLQERFERNVRDAQRERAFSSRESLVGAAGKATSVDELREIIAKAKSHFLGGDLASRRVTALTFQSMFSQAAMKRARELQFGENFSSVVGGGIGEITGALNEMFNKIGEQIRNIPNQVKGFVNKVNRDAAPKFLEGIGIQPSEKRRAFREEGLRRAEDNAIANAAALGFPVELIREIINRRRDRRAGRGDPIHEAVKEALGQGPPRQQSSAGGQFFGLLQFGRMLQSRLSAQDPVVKAVDRNREAVKEVEAAIVQGFVGINGVGVF